MEHFKHMFGQHASCHEIHLNTSCSSIYEGLRTQAASVIHCVPHQAIIKAL